jgi:hypothetical protein
MIEDTHPVNTYLISLLCTVVVELGGFFFIVGELVLGIAELSQGI